MMTSPLNGLAGELRAALGARWDELHADIRERFTLPNDMRQQSFSGTMDVIERSPAG